MLIIWQRDTTSALDKGRQQRRRRYRTLRSRPELPHTRDGCHWKCNWIRADGRICYDTAERVSLVKNSNVRHNGANSRATEGMICGHFLHMYLWGEMVSLSRGDSDFLHLFVWNKIKSLSTRGASGICTRWPDLFECSEVVQGP